MKEYFKNYFNSAEPVCGEEKQYTLFFYNKLLAIAGKKSLKEKDLLFLKSCGIEGEDIRILSVAYEATYMRDIFLQERGDRKGENSIERCIGAGETENPSFNEMLFSYVNSEYKLPMEHVYINRNFGKGRVFKVMPKDGERALQMTDILKGMMNIKPDIAVFYENDKGKYFRLLACKYLSGESMNKGVTEGQLLQMVAGFLAERITAESKEKVTAETGSVYFISKRNEHWKCITEAPEHCIRVKDLIPKVLS